MFLLLPYFSLPQRVFQMVVVRIGRSRVLVFYGKVGHLDGIEYGRICCLGHYWCVTVLMILQCQSLHFVVVQLSGKLVGCRVGCSRGILVCYRTCLNVSVVSVFC